MFAVGCLGASQRVDHAISSLGLLPISVSTLDLVYFMLGGNSSYGLGFST